MALGFPNLVEVVPEETSSEDGDLAAADLSRHIARELHDRIAHPLIDVLLGLDELRSAPETGAALAGELAALEEATRQVLRQAREMMIDLRGRDDLRMNLIRAIKSEVQAPAGRRLTVTVTPRWPRQTGGWAAYNLLRIVQQASANAWRHGRANAVEVRLDVERADAVLVVTDDGNGIEDRVTGFGVEGMRERATVLGGSFSARSREAGGTKVEVRVPLAGLA